VLFRSAGFKKQLLGTHANSNLRISKDTKVWICEH